MRAPLRVALIYTLVSSWNSGMTQVRPQQRPVPRTPAPTVYAPPPRPQTPAQTAPAQPAPTQTSPAQSTPAPSAQTQTAVPAQSTAQTAGAAPAAPVTVPAGLNLTNASLVEVIDILARDLKINYILDPKVQGKVTINTYGELRAVDVRNLLETILRMNGFVMVQVGNIFRIVPADASSRLPVSPQIDLKETADSEQVVLDLIFLKYVTSAEMAKLVEPFLGEGYKMISYDPANLLIIQDNSRSMRRTLELIGMFDSETMAGQRVKSYTLTNGRPSDVARELEQIFRAYAFSDKNTALKFIPLDRISTIIAIAPNPASFKDVTTWLTKLDVPVKLSAGAIDNHVYKLKYGRAEIVGQVIAQLYGASVPTGMAGYGLTGYGGYRGGTLGGGFGGNFGGGYGGGGGGFGAGGYGGSSRGYTSGGFGNSVYGGANYGGTYGNAGGLYDTTGITSGAAANAAAAQAATQAGQAATTAPASGGTPFGTAVAPQSDETGQYLSPRQSGIPGAPRIIPNPFDNTLLVQSSPQQWEGILRLLEQLDIPPRQVLIDARIYEVELTGDLSYGVEALLQGRTTAERRLLGSSNKPGASGASSAGLLLSAGTLVGQSRELLAYVNALQSRSKAKSISSPQLIATDSIPASITVGTEVPTLSATSVSPGFGGTTTSAIQNVGTGTNLNVIARVNASGIITLVIDQDVSAPQATQTGLGVSGSPSFSRRNVSTQVTVQDGDTIAIGGIIQETATSSTAGIPGLMRIPYIGGLFGSTSWHKDRTELILFLTPHVIYDTNGISDATEELKSAMRTLKKDIRNQ